MSDELTDFLVVIEMQSNLTNPMTISTHRCIEIGAAIVSLRSENIALRKRLKLATEIIDNADYLLSVVATGFDRNGWLKYGALTAWRSTEEMK